MSSIDLTHHFLIAMPNMADPYFAKSLTYICEHNDQGALGLVVNRPIDMTLQALFERLQLTLHGSEHADAPVYFGGPVQTDRGFVLHAPAGNWQSTLRVGAHIGLTTSKDILEAVGRGEGQHDRGAGGHALIFTAILPAMVSANCACPKAKFSTRPGCVSSAAMSTTRLPGCRKKASRPARAGRTCR